MTSKDGHRRTIGLIQSTWGGTKIESWSSKQALSKCHVPKDSSVDSFLWNAMVHPYLRHGIKGALWYQGKVSWFLCTILSASCCEHILQNKLFIGEATSKYNRDLYKCTFPTMISDWRQHWAKTSRTAPVFPFGFVQLSTSVGKGVEDIRWHQVWSLSYSWIRLRFKLQISSHRLQTMVKCQILPCQTLSWLLP